MREAHRERGSLGHGRRQPDRVLVKGGAALEALGAIRAVALDKTGTLTRNQPTVVDVAHTGGYTREQVLDLAAAHEARSEHPLARAIIAAVQVPKQATGVEAITGAGLVGQVDGVTVRLGRPGWLQAGDPAARVTAMQESGAIAVLVEYDGKVIGAVAVRDELRPEAAEVVAHLHADGYTVAMLTGDKARTATALAKAAGIDSAHADLRPEDKSAIISQLREQRVTAMVGDGVNDAPALATADIGIAMGAMAATSPTRRQHYCRVNPGPEPLMTDPQPARRRRALLAATAGVGAVDLLFKAAAEQGLQSPIDLGVIQLQLTYNSGVQLRRRVQPRVGPARLDRARPHRFDLSGALGTPGAPSLTNSGPAALLPLGAILGGVVGNLVDRATDGVVTDYLHTGWFPTFNLADIFIVVGALIFALTHLAARPGAGSEPPPKHASR